jgi:DNA-binding NarL/FixJ family response regulator
MNPTQPGIHLAIVDDHFHARIGFEKSISENIPYINRISSFESGKALIECLEHQPLNIVLLDIQLKNEDGFCICKQIKKEHKQLKVIMTTAHENALYLVKTEQYGADGFLPKDCTIEDMEQAFHSVIKRGKKYFSATAREKIIEFKSKLHEAKSGVEDYLSVREIEMIPLICKGFVNAQIADIMNCAENTVATHRQRLMRKINAHSVVDIIRFAIKNNLYPGSE